MFENLSNDVVEIIYTYEDGAWDDSLSESELTNVKRLHMKIDYLKEILEDLVKKNAPLK